MTMIRSSNVSITTGLSQWVALLGLALAMSVRAQTVVQTYFVPFEEDEINVALNTIDDFDGNIGSTIRSTISIVGGITNTVLYWDHWEDGYEGLLVSPTQLTTQVWGDNNPLNGIPPGFSTDLVGEGDIVSLIDDIDIPRNPTVIAYDSRDKLSVSRWVAMSRYMYAPNPGEVLAGSAQIYDRSKYGFTFRAPVGINTGTNQMFEYASILVSAGYDSTVVRIDTDGDGIDETTVFLDEGDSYVARFTSEGARVVASKPIQCHMITGDIGSNYEMRIFELFPDNQWDSSYYTSVFTASGIPTEVYLFNPNDAAISVVCETLSGSSTVSVPPNVSVPYVMPGSSGANFYTTNNESFVAVSVTDAGQSTSGNQAYDWGHSLVPVRALTSVSIVPWAPGSGGTPITGNGNPVWVTAESNTTLYIDWDGDSTTGPLVDSYGRRYDFSTNVVRLQSIRLYDSSDLDQTGLRIYTTNGTRFATTWGQDPAVAGTGNPYLDMGSAVFPFPTVPAVKEWDLLIDLNTNGVVNPGETVEFSIYVVNVGYSLARDVLVYDTGALFTTYEPGSTYVNGTNIADDVMPPASTLFPLDELGLNVGDMQVGQTSIVTYAVVVDDPFPTNVDGLVNGVYVDNQTQVFVPIPIPGFGMVKSSTPTNPVAPGDTISYTLDVVNTGNIYQAGITIVDQLPSTLTWVPESTRIMVDGQFDGYFLDEFRVVDEYNGDDGSIAWNGNWIEVGESDGPGFGDVQVLGDSGSLGDPYMLQIQNSSQGVYRRANLGGFTNAFLYFDYRRESFEGGESMLVQASVNGGSSWSTVMTVAGTGDDAVYIPTTNNLSAYISTNFALRFIGNGSLSSGDRVFVDNVRIAVSGLNTTNMGFATPTIVQGYALASGQTMRVTFDTTVDPDISVSSVVNRAYITSFNSPAPLEASVTNRVNLPDRSLIAGWVRNDTDADGNLNDAESGIAGVSITLFTDPNGDGNASDGAVIASATTLSNGYYELGYFLSNNFVILETDPLNFLSTADADGGNPNLIALTTVSGVHFTNNIFLDTRLAPVSGQVRFDEDGDGDFDDPDTGIEGATVLVFTDPNGDGDPSDGVQVGSHTTTSLGDFVIPNISTGYFVVVEIDPPGLLSTADSNGANDNRVPIYMAGGLSSTGTVFLDTTSGLSIEKSASPPGIWFPNLQARYTITILNTGSMTHTGVQVTDLLETGLVYVSDSTYITANVVSSNNVRDTFSTVSYSRNDGSVNWLGDWIENDGGGGGASSGGIFVNGGALNIGDLVTGQPAIQRSIDLSDAVSAHLTFDYDTTPGVDSTDEVTLSISTNGTTWTEIGDYLGEVTGAEDLDISGYISANTRIRFDTVLNYNGGDEYFLVDNIQVYWETESLQTVTGPPPPSLISGMTLTPGDSVTIVFTAEVAVVDAVTNIACLTSSVLTNGLCSTVVSLVDTGATPDRISGQVRFDADDDGDLSDPDFGIQGVNLQLYTDPNGDGNPADGVLIDSTATESMGYYIFGELTNGHYVVVELDTSGYVSTQDADGGNDNQIAVFLPGGTDSRDNDFLDRTLSGLIITKSSDKPSVVVPGESLTYYITVSNTRPTIATGIRVEDILPEGLVYQPGSAWMEISGLTVSNTVQDLFNSRSYANQDGSANWLGNWAEVSDDGSPYGGDVALLSDLGSYSLRIRDDSNAAYRSADLSGGTYANLSFYYRRQGLEAGEYVALWIAPSTSGPWTQLAQYGNNGAYSTTDGSYQYETFDIQDYMSEETTIYFESPGGGMSDGDLVYFDDITIDYGYSISISTNAAAPPQIVSNVMLSAGKFLRVSFTSHVDYATSDYLVNTGMVYSSLDTNGLRSSTSNFIGEVAMTQGMVVASAEEMGIRVGWSAYTNEQGVVVKDYDVMYVDDFSGFRSSLTSGWEWVGTVKDTVMIDTGDSSRIPPTALGNKMRFYRASFKDTWTEDKVVRYATKEIYVAKCVDLVEGENLISLFMIPDDNRVAAVLGTNRLPVGDTVANATRVEWYNTGGQNEATNVIWLSNAGIWQHVTGGIADNMPMPLDRGFNLILPPGSGERELLLVGKMPTNTTPEFGHAVPVAGQQAYSVVSYNLPFRIKLKDSGLRESGFTGTPGIFNPLFSDEIRIMEKGGGSLESPKYRILMNKNSEFQYWSGGTGSAEDHLLEPDDAIVIYTRRSPESWTWNVNLPYPPPTVYMTP